jgi:hypothetical protein
MERYGHEVSTSKTTAKEFEAYARTERTVHSVRSGLGAFGVLLLGLFSSNLLLQIEHKT